MPVVLMNLLRCRTFFMQLYMETSYATTFFTIVRILKPEIGQIGPSLHVGPGMPYTAGVFDDGSEHIACISFARQL